MFVSERVELEAGLHVRARGQGETRAEAANDANDRLRMVQRALQDYRETCIDAGSCPWCADYSGDSVAQHAAQAHPGRWAEYDG